MGDRERLGPPAGDARRAARPRQRAPTGRSRSPPASSGPRPPACSPARSGLAPVIVGGGVVVLLGLLGSRTVLRGLADVGGEPAGLTPPPRPGRDLRAIDSGPRALLFSYALCIASMRCEPPRERPMTSPLQARPVPDIVTRAAGPQGPRPHRVRPRVDEPEPAACVPDRPRPRPRLRDRGHRRQRVPRLRRRHRRQLDRPQPPRRRGRDPAPGRELLQHFSASDFYLPIYAQAAAELARIAPFARPGARVHRQQRRRGGRGRAQARPVPHASART